MGVTKYVPLETGTYTVTPGDVSAIASVIPLENHANGYIVQITRTGELVGADAGIAVSPTTSPAMLAVADGTVYTLTAGDVINYITF